MFNDVSRISDAIHNPRFHPGDHVVLAEGPRKCTSGAFVSLRADVEWANIREWNGVLSMHPVEWMRADIDRKIERPRPSEEENLMKQLSENDVPCNRKSRHGCG
jgi:hypothetical protein